MKRLKIAFIVAVVGVAGFFMASQAHAAGLYVATEKGDAVVAADKTVDSSAYLAGQNVLVEGTVKGDLYCAGDVVKISGTIEGDVLCGAQTSLMITGTVKGDIRVAASTVMIDGSVGSNATILARDTTMTKKAIVTGDVTGGTASFTLDGGIGRDLLIGSSVMKINGTVGRDVNAGLETLSIAPGAKIAGNLSYQSTNEASIPEGVVAGKTTYTVMTQGSQEGTSGVAMALMVIAAFVILAVVVTLIMPKYVHEASIIPMRQAVLAFLLGFAAIILLPMLAVIAFVAMVGSLLGAVLLAAWLLLMLLSGVFFAYYVGALVLGKRGTHAIVVVLVGSVMIGIVLMVPVVNVILMLVLLGVGVGMQLLRLQYQFSKHPYKIEA